MEYQTHSHCQHLIALHLILVVKYRKQLLQGEVGDFVKLKIIEISSRSESDMEEIEVDKDHIHILLTISLTICAASYVCRIKQSTTENLWRKFGWLKSSFGSKKPFSLTDTLSVQSVIHPLKQCVNRFKNKVSLSIHPTDAALRRSMGFLDRFDKKNPMFSAHRILISSN
jgi:putative transposase